MREPGAGLSARTTAGDLERTVLARIARGDYPVGSKMPSCEQLGRELGANKNTVSKVYRSLSQSGIIISKAGQGTTVIKRPGDQAGGEPSSVLVILMDAVAQAAREGVSQRALESLAMEAIRRTFDADRVRIGYIDCTRSDAQDLARRLAAALSVPVTPLVASHINKDADPGRFDILAVNVAHLRYVERRLHPFAALLVPIVSLPDPESLTQIARLPAGTKVVIVSDTEEALHSLMGLARGFSSAVHLSGLLSRDANVGDAVGGADVVLVTRSAYRRVAAMNPVCEVVQVAFKLDDGSVLRLAQELASFSNAGPVPPGQPVSRPT